MAVALEAGAKLALSTSIADVSAVLVGCVVEVGVTLTVGSADALACTNDNPEGNCGKEGGVRFWVGGRNRELGSWALMGCGCGAAALDITGDALARNSGRGGVRSTGCLFCKLGVDGADIVIERTGS